MSNLGVDKFWENVVSATSLGTPVLMNLMCVLPLIFGHREKTNQFKAFDLKAQF